MRRAVGIAVVLLAGVGCASAATALVAAPDDAAVAPGNLTLRVGLGPLVPPRYRAGVRVRATNGTRNLDALTDAAGDARFTVDAAARWDVTAAEPGYAAVSLVGARAGLRAEVLLRPTVATRPAEVRDVTVTGTLRGRSMVRAAVLLDGARGTTVSRDDTFTLTAPTWPGAPALRVTAIELDASSGLVRGWISPSLDLASAPPPVAIDLAAGAPSAVSMELRVEFPVVGRVTPATFDRVLSEQVARTKYTEYGVGLVPVGRSHLAAPGAGTFARWVVEAFEGDLAPELIFASLRIGGAAALTATVTTRPSFRGVVPAFAPVSTLAASGTGTLDAQTLGWSRAAFSVTVGDAVAWEGYGVDDTAWMTRAMPSLPAGVTLAALAPSRAPAVMRACVLSDLPLSPPAWVSPAPAMALRNLLTVCEEQGAALAGP